MFNKIFAVVGDVHGEQLKMVQFLKQWEQQNQVKLDFVLQVGDFESLRNEQDLALMSVPAKHRKLGQFHLFSSGEEIFPWPVCFIGGNHEAYGYLEQHPTGFELVKNCFYMGRVGRQSIHGIRVAGLSGIYSPAKFNQKRPNIKQKKQFPVKHLTYFNEDDINSILKYGGVDVLLLHDWPKGINGKGPPFGNEYARLLIEKLKPDYVYCGHIHRHLETQMMVGDKKINIVCLPNLSQGDKAFSFYGINNGQITPIH